MKDQQEQYNKIEIHEKFVVVEGLGTRCLSVGEGPPVILVHGLGEFLESWMYNISELSKCFTVYALELPGHGHSEKSTERYTPNFTRRFVLSFMQVMGIHSASMIGHSMGAVVCIELAVEFPDKVEKLVLVDSGGFERKLPLGYRMAALPLIGNIMLGPPQIFTKKTVKFGMRRQFYEPKIVPDEWIDIACRHFRRPDRNETIINIIKNYSRSFQDYNGDTITHKMMSLKQPVLIIHGNQDKVVPVTYARMSLELINSAVLTIFECCGHNPQIEKAAEFNETVKSFLTFRNQV